MTPSDPSREALTDDPPCTDGNEHEWTIERDWYGAPGVINGTQTFYTAHCEICGCERPATADEWSGQDDDL